MVTCWVLTWYRWQESSLGFFFLKEGCQSHWEPFALSFCHLLFWLGFDLNASFQSSYVESLALNVVMRWWSLLRGGSCWNAAVGRDEGRSQETQN